MNAIATHRDREARHFSQYRIDCLSMASSLVKAKSRRSLRAAGKASLRSLLDEALADRELELA